VSEGGFEEGVDEGFWNIFLISIFGFTSGAAADRTGEGAAVEVEAVGDTTGGLEDMDAFPLT
jgi:hypothetical protein